MLAEALGMEATRVVRALSQGVLCRWLPHTHPSLYPAFLSPYLQHAPPLFLSGLSMMQSVLCHGPEPINQL